MKDSMHTCMLMRKITLMGGEFQREEHCWSKILLERKELPLVFDMDISSTVTGEKVKSVATEARVRQMRNGGMQKFSSYCLYFLSKMETKILT